MTAPDTVSEAALPPGITVTVPELPPASRAREALETPYTLARWREDLQRMGAGVSTGFDVLEELGMHWTPATITAVIARPGAGKTAFLLEACARMLEAHPEETAVLLSWEEPVAELVNRLLLRADAQRTRPQDGSAWLPPIHLETVRQYARGEAIASAYRARLEAVAPAVEALLTRLRLVDGDEVGREVHATLREVAAWMREEGRAPGLVAVDYFQKLEGDPNSHNRLHELQDVTNTLRRFVKGDDLAGEGIDKAFAVPVLIGGQVNRMDSQTRGENGGHPTGDNIREGDELLNEASRVIALSWAERGDGDAVAAAATEREDVRWLRLSVPKHRGGRTRGTFGGEVARLEWRPARGWLHDTAQCTAAGRVAWEKPVAPGAEDRADTSGLKPPTADELLNKRTGRG